MFEETYGNEKIWVVNTQILKSEFAKLAVELKTRAALAKHFNVNAHTIGKIIKKEFVPELPIKTGRLDTMFLSLFNLKKCNSCGKNLPPEKFAASSKAADGKHGMCKICTNSKSKDWYQQNHSQARETRTRYYERNKPEYRAQVAKRRAAKAQRTPSWADQEKIKEIYKNCPEGHHVDHFYPLLGKDVSGLHVPENLRYLTAEENFRKGNKLIEED